MSFDSEWILAMTFTREQQRSHGMDLKTDHEGLPSDLRLPPPPPQPPQDPPNDSSESSAQASHAVSANPTAVNTTVNTANTTAVTTPVHEDEPPPEFLTEHPLEGVPHQETWTEAHLLANKKALLDVLVEPLNATLDGKPEEGAVPHTTTIEEVEAFTERRALSPHLPQVPQDEVPLAALQGLSEHVNRAEFLDEKTRPARLRAYAAYQQFHAELESAKVEFERVSQASVARKKAKEAARTGLLGPQLKERGGFLPSCCGDDGMEVTPGWEEKIDDGSSADNDAARAITSRVDREPMNSQNCGYYIGRRDPGPGAASVERRQIGFEPEEGAWMFLVGHRHGRNNGQ